MSSETALTNERIRQMLELADRLRDEGGGVLDDAAVDAVAEATGAPVEYVRIALATDNEEQAEKRSVLQRLREVILTIDSRLRRSVLVGSLGIGTGLFFYLGRALSLGGDLAGSIVALILMGGLITASMSTARSTSAVLGAVLGATAYFMFQISAVVHGLFSNNSLEMHWSIMIAAIFGGAVAASAGHSLWRKIGRKLGIRDAADERRELVEQLMEIQEKLQSEERYAAFLSIDIVGSTQMKQDNDALAIEFTFSEYHKFIEAVANKHGGRIHSTAGDGVICVFDSPDEGFDAGRATLAGLFEFNAFRNKIAEPITVRAGLHSGQVHAPGRDAGSVNFAHVIDISAHLQKEADPGTLAVSQSLINDLQAPSQVDGTDTLHVSGVDAVIWRPRSAGGIIAGLSEGS